MNRARNGRRGAALLMVLWLLGLLTVVVGGFVLVSRTEALQGRAARSGTQARYAAEAGIDYAMARVQDPLVERRWHADGRAYRLPFDGAEVEIRIVDESGKVDLNAADAEILARLFMALEIDEDTARGLAGAILDWRDADDLLQPVGGAESAQYAAAGRPYGARNAPFDSVAELQLVLGMTPAFYRAAAPHLTVFSGLALPNPQFAQGPVLEALGLDPLQREEILAAREAADAVDPGLGVAAFGTGSYSIESTATLADGATAHVSATVRAGGGPGGRIYVPLNWRLGEVF
ncbi:general secretion pathway protein GspK [Coralloluteibacterium thermophilus]|uniref:General secretion pathway protein GspK n=1 Tax=Coralloluteibacterium thermophilum TaxID=2707049 RepID=A0ABV9NQ71_9GAMM